MQETTKNTSVMHNFSQPGGLFSTRSLIIFAVIVVAGIGVGYTLSQSKGSITTSTTTQSGSSASVAKGTVVGSNDTSTFKDTAEGVLQKGGIADEGQFHLVRPGGDSQNVYVTSSIVDLSQFVGKKIKVNGETQKAQHAGWLMDVGRVEVLE